MSSQSPKYRELLSRVGTGTIFLESIAVKCAKNIVLSIDDSKRFIPDFTVQR